jgi:hypothetical protein
MFEWFWGRIHRIVDGVVRLRMEAWKERERAEILRCVVAILDEDAIVSERHSFKAYWGDSRDSLEAEVDKLRLGIWSKLKKETEDDARGVAFNMMKGYEEEAHHIVEGEAFIDEIVDRINRKQVGK